MYDVLTVGETMAVFYPEQLGELHRAEQLLFDIAGAESNLAIALSRLGHRVRFVSRIGNDPFGNRIRDVLIREQVDTTHLRRDDRASTGLMFRECLADGKRRVFYYRSGSAASRMEPSDLSTQMFDDVKILHITGITPALSATCAATIEYAISLAKQHGVRISFDPNYRPLLWDAATARKVLLPLMRQADILLMGHEDCQALLGIDDEKLILEQGREWGASIVVLKQAERGASAASATEHLYVPAIPVEQVVDPVGAGDGFNAGFLSGLLRGKSIKESLQLAAHIGAATVSHIGDYGGYPYHKE